MLKLFNRKYNNFVEYLKEHKGIYGSKPIIFISAWWPIFSVIFFARYYYTGDRLPLGDARAYWWIGRTLCLAASALCLLFPKAPWCREVLGYAFAIYGAVALSSYWQIVPLHDKAFWGDMVGTFCLILLLLSLTICSFLVLRYEKIMKYIQNDKTE